jgi:arginine-tRNA-protein transferase
MQAPLEVLPIYDEPSPCPYLAGRTSRMPLRMPMRRLTPREFEACLIVGDRRSGSFLYNTQCDGCRACEPIRIDVQRFAPSRTQARTFKRGERLFRTQIGAPRVDAEHVALYNRHKQERGLGHPGGEFDDDSYREFLVESCCETREIAYYLEDRLAMIAIVDVGENSLSAVYTYFNPDLERYSPGVYSVLKEVELCRAWQKQYLYLGYYIADSEHMRYKATYLPHERRINGAWREIGK